MTKACFALLAVLAAWLCGPATGLAAEPEKPIFDRDWIAGSSTAMGVTGDARLTPGSITFDHRVTFRLRFLKEMVPVNPPSEWSDTPSYSLYEIVDPKPQEIHNGNHLCGHPQYTRNLRLGRYMAIGLASGDKQDKLRIMVFSGDTPPADVSYGLKESCGGLGYFRDKATAS